jgi:hypothetical protein
VQMAYGVEETFTPVRHSSTDEITSVDSSTTKVPPHQSLRNITRSPPATARTPLVLIYVILFTLSYNINMGNAESLQSIVTNLFVNTLQKFSGGKKMHTLKPLALDILKSIVDSLCSQELTEENIRRRMDASKGIS